MSLNTKTRPKIPKFSPSIAKDTVEKLITKRMIDHYLKCKKLKQTKQQYLNSGSTISDVEDTDKFKQIKRDVDEIMEDYTRVIYRFLRCPLNQWIQQFETDMKDGKFFEKLSLKCQELESEMKQEGSELPKDAQPGPSSAEEIEVVSSQKSSITKPSILSNSNGAKKPARKISLNFVSSKPKTMTSVKFGGKENDEPVPAKKVKISESGDA